MKRIFNFGVIVVSAFLALASCHNPFAPVIVDRDIGRTNLITDQSTPDEVLTNFRFAYMTKDSLIYRELFDSTFTFMSWNYNEPPPVPIQWGLDKELKIAGRMFRLIHMMDVTFSVTRRDTLKRDNKGMAEIIEHQVIFTLTLDGGVLSTLTFLKGEVKFLYLRRGKRWLISRWEDLRI